MWPRIDETSGPQFAIEALSFSRELNQMSINMSSTACNT